MKIQDCVPLGIDGKRELKYIAIGLAGAVLYSIRFLFRYFDARSNLYYWDQKKEESVLRTGAVIASFENLTDGIFSAFLVLDLLLLMLTLWHYLYHYQGSKSIWLMKRLPKRTELYRRCVMIPVLAAASGMIVVGILLVLYYQVYIRCTPAACLTI